MRRILVIASVAVLVMSLGSSAVARHDRPGSPAFHPRSEPFGTPYGVWGERWIEWLVELPVPRNPAVHPENCARLNVGRVLFLGPNGGTCTIPANKAVLISPSGWECSTAEGLGDTYAELRRCAVENFRRDFGRDVFRLDITVDGRPIGHERAFHFLTPNSVIDFPRNNLFGARPGPSKAVTMLFAYMLKPFPPGTHTIRVHVVDGALGEEFTITYRLRAR
jgi:hypothetical protein